MKIAFTICSNNYLAQAKVLGDSIKKYSPDYEFFIGLVDKPSELIDYEKEIGYEILLVEDIGIPALDSLWKKYEIVEFNTCVKPFYFEYFMHRYKELEFVYYLDPDTCLFDSINKIEQEFKPDSDILITPHVFTPINLDGKQPDEPIFLNYGIYNLGFLGLRNSKISGNLINWWKERTYNLCYAKMDIGLFVDQLWFNLVPLYFDNVTICSNRGINMGPWNLHERFLTGENDQYTVNAKDKLILYHFSNYNYNDSNTLASYYDRYNFEERADTKELYLDYLNKLCSQDIAKITQIPCFYMEARASYINETLKMEQYKLLLEEKKKRNTIWWVKMILKYSLPLVITKYVLKLK